MKIILHEPSEPYNTFWLSYYHYTKRVWLMNPLNPSGPIDHILSWKVLFTNPLNPMSFLNSLINIWHGKYDYVSLWTLWTCLTHTLKWLMYEPSKSFDTIDPHLTWKLCFMNPLNPITLFDSLITIIRKKFDWWTHWTLLNLLMTLYLEKFYLWTLWTQWAF